MTFLDMLGFKEVYPDIANISLPFQSVYKLSKIAAALESEYEFYQSKFNAILEEYAQKDEFGQYVVDESGKSVRLIPDKINECITKIEELQKVTITEPTEFLSPDDLKDINLTMIQMNKLLPFIR